MYSLVTTQRFDTHFQDILDYIAFELENPRAALNFADGLEELMDCLTLMPKLYPVYGSTHSRPEIEYRYIAFGNYVIFYSIDETEKRVVLEDIIYGKRLE